MKLGFALLCVLAFQQLGCGGTISPPTDDASSPATDSATKAPSQTETVSTSDAAAVDGSTRPQACNVVADVGSHVAWNNVASVPPTPSGGTIVDGTYVLVDLTTYTGPGGKQGPTGETVRSTVQIAGNVSQVVSELNGSTNRNTMTFTTNSTSIAHTETCPGKNTHLSAFTASESTIKVFVRGPSASETIVETYARN